jgi:NAD+ kinase
MSGNFPVIGLFAKPTPDVQIVLHELISFLHTREHELLLNKTSVGSGEKFKAKILSADKIAEKADLIIVIGGDGSLLHTSREIVNYDIPIIGINRGKLGFLADINPNNFKITLTDILDGKYVEELRSMLEVTIIKNGKKRTALALNDIVLFNSNLSKMLEFNVYIDDQYVMHHRADGLITSTPTGSTAYSMSGGGPILYPTLNALTLLPMFAHTLSSRPLVIDNKSEIKLVLLKRPDIEPRISCDGQVHIDLDCNDEIYIRTHSKALKLIHPLNYNYFQTLSEKLGWNHNLTSERFMQG